MVLCGGVDHRPPVIWATGYVPLVVQSHRQDNSLFSLSPEAPRGMGPPPKKAKPSPLPTLTLTRPAAPTAARVAQPLGPPLAFPPPPTPPLPAARGQTDDCRALRTAFEQAVADGAKRLSGLPLLAPLCDSLVCAALAWLQLLHCYTGALRSEVPPPPKVFFTWRRTDSGPPLKTAGDRTYDRGDHGELQALSPADLLWHALYILGRQVRELRQAANGGGVARGASPTA